MYGTCKPGPDDFFWTCSDCGAVVINRERHDQWHRDLSAHSHTTLSVIGGQRLANRHSDPEGKRTRWDRARALVKPNLT